ncbi:MAG TPA: cysteine hydrolase family protein [Deferrisomatales bacterium]|nr:cysteine hydrolase family protein [Deferrisomatales bacterium]
MSRGLLLVDIQNDYFPGGAMELVGMDRAAARAAEALEAFRAESLPVFHVQHLAAQPGATFFQPGTPGAEIHPLVAPRDGEARVQKHFPNGFRGTPLLDRLRDRGVTDLTLCGAMSHMCIDATTRAAFDLGFSCTVLADACATRDLAFSGVAVPAAQVHAAFMAALAAVYARVSGADG